MFYLRRGVENLVVSTVEAAIEMSCSLADGACTFGGPVAATLLPPSFPQPSPADHLMVRPDPNTGRSEHGLARNAFAFAVHEAAERGASRFKSCSPKPWDGRNPIEIDRQIQDLTLLRSRLAREKEDLDDSIGHLNERITRRHSQYAKLTTAVHTLHRARSRQLSLCLAASAQLRAGKLKVLAGEEKVRAEGAKLVKVSKRLDKTQAMVTSTEAHLDSLKADVEKAQSDLATAKEDHLRVTQATSTEREHLRAIKDDISRARKDLHTVGEETNAAKKKAQRDTNQAEDDIAKLHSEIGAAESELTKKQSRIDELSAKEKSINVEIKALVSSRERLQAELDVSGSELSEMNRAADDIGLLMEEKRAALEDLETEIQDTQSRRTIALARADEAEARFQSRNHMAVDLDFQLSAVFRQLDDAAVALQMTERRLASTDSTGPIEANIPLPPSRPATPNCNITIFANMDLEPSSLTTLDSNTCISEAISASESPTPEASTPLITPLETKSQPSFDPVGRLPARACPGATADTSWIIVNTRDADPCSLGDTLLQINDSHPLLHSGCLAVENGTKNGAHLWRATTVAEQLAKDMISSVWGLFAGGTTSWSSGA